MRVQVDGDSGGGGKMAGNRGMRTQQHGVDTQLEGSQGSTRSWEAACRLRNRVAASSRCRRWPARPGWIAVQHVCQGVSSKRQKRKGETARRSDDTYARHQGEQRGDSERFDSKNKGKAEPR
eukprot:352845-Chlamydomonas_euryale.AAC.2